MYWIMRDRERERESFHPLFYQRLQRPSKTSSSPSPSQDHPLCCEKTQQLSLDLPFPTCRPPCHCETQPEEATFPLLSPCLPPPLTFVSLYRFIRARAGNLQGPYCFSKDSLLGPEQGTCKDPIVFERILYLFIFFLRTK